MFTLSPTLHIAENTQNPIQTIETIHFNDMNEASNIFLKIRGIKNLYNIKSEKDMCPCKAAQPL